MSNTPMAAFEAEQECGILQEQVQQLQERLEQEKIAHQKSVAEGEAARQELIANAAADRNRLLSKIGTLRNALHKERAKHKSAHIPFILFLALAVITLLVCGLIGAGLLPALPGESVAAGLFGCATACGGVAWDRSGYRRECK